MKLPLALALLCFALPAAAGELNRATTLIDQQQPQDIIEPDTPYGRTIADLPLMPGLVLPPREDMLRLTSQDQGRVTESVAEGTVDIDELYVFYRRELPLLGWQKLDARSFSRDGEYLRIDAHADGKLTVVRFSLRPI